MTDSEKLDKLLAWTERHEVKFDNLAGDVGENRDVLYGNGRPGILTRLQTVEERQKAGVVGAWGKWCMDVARNVVSACVIGLIAWLLGVWKWGWGG